jgi:glycosyltransferase involved in cell wall biosynthesis
MEAPEGARPNLPEKAKDKGLPLCHPLAQTGLNLCTHLSWALWVKELLKLHNIDILHVHQSREHLLGSIAIRLGRLKTRLLRTNFKGVPLAELTGGPVLLRCFTDAYITFSQASYQKDKPFLPPGRAWYIQPALSLKRYIDFSPSQDMRRHFGIPPQGFLFGVVARVQRHRRFDVILKAVHEAVKQVPTIKLLILGRGTHLDEIAVRPVKQLGLQGHVIFAGYRTDDYLDTLASIDSLIYLVPGSDGTCRALREAMALGKPVIAAKRGMIPELVDDRITGWVIKDSPENLTEAIIYFASHPEEVRQMGKAGYQKALRLWSISDQTRNLYQIYKQIVRGPSAP